MIQFVEHFGGHSIGCLFHNLMFIFFSTCRYLSRVWWEEFRALAYNLFYYRFLCLPLAPCWIYRRVQLRRIIDFFSLINKWHWERHICSTDFVSSSDHAFLFSHLLSKVYLKGIKRIVKLLQIVYFDKKNNFSNF